MPNADRIMNNFCRNPNWTADVTDEELNYMIEKYDTNCIFCNGRVRKLKIKKLTDKYFSLSTEEL